MLIGEPGKDESYPLVSVEDFFEGDDDLGSIGCNLFEHPGIAEFYDTFRKIKSRKDVFDVLLQITEIEPQTKGIWPFCDHVFIITSNSIYNTWALVKHLQPTDVFLWQDTYKLANMPTIPKSYQVITVWWD